MTKLKIFRKSQTISKNQEISDIAKKLKFSKFKKFKKFPIISKNFKKSENFQ